MSEVDMEKPISKENYESYFKLFLNWMINRNLKYLRC